MNKELYLRASDATSNHIRLAQMLWEFGIYIDVSQHIELKPYMNPDTYQYYYAFYIDGINLHKLMYIENNKK